MDMKNALNVEDTYLYFDPKVCFRLEESRDKGKEGRRETREKRREREGKGSCRLGETGEATWDMMGKDERQQTKA